MRRLLFAGLLAACATMSGPRLPPNPGWIGGQRVSVMGPQSVGVGGPELAGEYLHDLTESDLRAAGFEVGGGGLSLVIENFERAEVQAVVLSGAAVVEHIAVTADQLGCISSMWGLSASDNAHCYASGIVSAMMKSQAVARAAGAPTRAMAKVEPPPLAVSPAPQEQRARQEQAAAQQELAAPPERRTPEERRGVLPLRGKLAVLDLKNFTRELTQQNAQYFTDVIRQASLRMEPGLDIMTRENLMVLLQSTGKKLEECEGECEVDTGRRIGADQIISGEIQKVGSKFKLTLKLHDTHEGRLLASSIGSGKSIDELDEGAQKAAEELFTLR
jgi:hypothetical protein